MKLRIRVNVSDANYHTIGALLHDLEPLKIILLFSLDGYTLMEQVIGQAIQNERKAIIPIEASIYFKNQHLRRGLQSMINMINLNCASRIAKPILKDFTPLIPLETFMYVYMNTMPNMQLEMLNKVS